MRQKNDYGCNIPVVLPEGFRTSLVHIGKFIGPIKWQYDDRESGRSEMGDWKPVKKLVFFDPPSTVRQRGSHFLGWGHSKYI